MLRRTVIVGVLASAFCAASVYAASDFRLERHLNLAPGGSFSVDADGASVSLVGDASSGASVTITSNRDDIDRLYDIRFDEQPGSVHVAVKRRDRGWFSGWRGDLRIEAHVPRTTSVDLQTSGGSIAASSLAREARLRTSGGSVQAEQIDADLDAHTSGGSIRARQIHGAARVGTSGGSIDLSDVRGPVQAGTSGGSVDVHGAGDRVDAHTAGGSVTVMFLAGVNRGGDLSTSGGTVRAEIDPTVALTVDASTSGGGVTADVPLTVQGHLSRTEVHGNLNGGGSLLRLHTSGGGIHIGPIAR